MDPVLVVIIGVACAAVAGAIAFFAGIRYRKKKAEFSIAPQKKKPNGLSVMP